MGESQCVEFPEVSEPPNRIELEVLFEMPKLSPERAHVYQSRISARRGGSDCE